MKQQIHFLMYILVCIVYVCIVWVFASTFNCDVRDLDKVYVFAIFLSLGVTTLKYDWGLGALAFREVLKMKGGTEDD